MNFTEQEITKAIDWLRDNSVKCAEAKAHREYCKQYLKTVKAMVFMDKTGNIPEREAQACMDDRYIAQIDELKKAVYEDEYLKALKGAAELKIMAWQTWSANNRATRI